MDPISAIANAVGSIFGSVTSIVGGIQQRRAAEELRKSPWTNAADFKDNTTLYVIGGTVVFLVIGIIALAVVAKRK